MGSQRCSLKKMNLLTTGDFEGIPKVQMGIIASANTENSLVTLRNNVDLSY